MPKSMSRISFTLAGRAVSTRIRSPMLMLSGMSWVTMTVVIASCLRIRYTSSVTVRRVW